MTIEEEGEVKDLVEKLRKGELTPEEALQELKRRALFHHANEPFPGTFAILGMVVWVFLWFLPVIDEILDLNLAGIPSIEMPFEIVYLSLFLLVAMAPPLFYSAHLREKRSVTGDENVILVKDGAYGLVRHPAALAGLIVVVSLPIILNRFALEIPFTPLTVLGMLAAFAATYLQVWNEEKINIRKWGGEYRQYMKEVPRFNFILGIWRWLKRRNKKEGGRETISLKSRTDVYHKLRVQRFFLRQLLDCLYFGYFGYAFLEEVFDSPL
jgi:protein-S-isoprenylcysteine O-methyltransferase Ste14